MKHLHFCVFWNYYFYYFHDTVADTADAVVEQVAFPAVGIRYIYLVVRLHYGAKCHYPDEIAYIHCMNTVANVYYHPDIGGHVKALMA